MGRGLPIRGIVIFFGLSANAFSQFAEEDIQYWIGQGEQRAVLVVDWHATGQSALAWGYRFDEPATTEQMLREIAAADPNLYVRLGTRGAFGVPLFGVGYDRDRDGFALTDGTIFERGVAVTGPSDGATAFDDRDSYAEGWFDGYWSLYQASEGPYTHQAWQASSHGISGQSLTDGFWSGLSFAVGSSIEPNLPEAAQKIRSTLAVAEEDSPSIPPWLSPAGGMSAVRPVPEPTSCVPWALLAGVGLLLRCRAIRSTIGPKWIAAWLMAGLVASDAAVCRAGEAATSVVQFTPGIGVASGFDDPTAALGTPTRFTSPSSPFGGPVTPFNAPFGAGELVTVGHGGSLTLSFERPVFDRDQNNQARVNEFGFDLIVFGNAFFFDGDYPNGVVSGIGSEPGTIELSQDGEAWRTVPANADALFPTLAYLDVVDPFATSGGTLPTNFHQPVDPDLDPLGLSFREVIDAYNGSGGGTGVDIGATGLEWIQFIRFSNPHDKASAITPEIDAVTVVPEPTCSFLAIVLAFLVAPTRKHG